MELGDLVYSISQQQRFPDAGRLVALFDVWFFENVMCQQQPDSKTWDEACPDWRSKPLAMVYYADPQKTLTLEEWVNAGVEQGYDEAQSEKDYEEMCPTTQQVIYPLGDLEPEEPQDDAVGDRPTRPTLDGLV